MLNEPQIGKLIGKIELFTTLIEPMIFDKQGELECSAFLTQDRLHDIPADDKFAPVEKAMYGTEKTLTAGSKVSIQFPKSLQAKICL